MAITKRLVGVKRDFDMNSTSSCKFHHSQWEECRDDEHFSYPYLIYRLAFMIILVSSMTFSTLCQSYLFEIFLTNWSFTLQTLYAVLFSFTILWKMRGSLLQSFRMKFYRIYPESNVKAYEMKETNNSSWNNPPTTEDRNNMIASEQGENSTCVNIANSFSEEQPQQQQHHSTITTDSSCVRKSETSVIISNNNVDKNNKISHEDPPNMLEKMIWVLMNVSHVLPHVVAFGYWIFVYKYDPDQKACERFRSHFIVHGATSGLAFIDALIVAVPVRKSHFVFSSFVLLVYALFSYIYEVAGGPYRNGKEFIYSILNWRYKPGRTILICVVGIIISPLLHLITCWGIHHVKLWLVSWNSKRKHNIK